MRSSVGGGCHDTIMALFVSGSAVILPGAGSRPVNELMHEYYCWL